jgi:DNA-directed RNA polymerase specialized sigma24 family protein
VTTAVATLSSQVAAKVSLEDVADVSGYARWAAERTFSNNGRMTGDELEEAVGQAVLLIYEVHAAWDRTKCASFSAYLITMLPKRLIDWWRRDLRQSGRGRFSAQANEYTYHGMVSLDDTLALVGDERHDSALTVYTPGAD